MNLSDGNCDMADETMNIDLERCQISITEGASVKKKKPKKKKGSNGPGGTTPGTGFIFSSDREKLLKISQIEGKGRCLLAKCAIKAGTCYYTERAVAVVAHNGGLCSHCSKHIGHNNKSCPTDAKLLMERFCSPACLQVFSSDPARYRYSQAVNDCIPQAANASSCDKDLLRMVFRLLGCFAFPSTLVESEDASAVCTDEAGVVRATRLGVLSLEAHLSHQSAAWIAAVGSGITIVLDALDQQEIKLQLPEEAEGEEVASSVVADRAALLERALFLACIVNVNAYGILGHSDDGEGALGFGLFPAVGLCVNHSCLPNSYYTHNPQTGCMEYRTLRDVRAGEELTVSYVDVFQDTPQRRQSIAKTRFFVCGCSRCAGYDVAVTTTKAICATPVKKLSKAETEASRSALSPFYCASADSSTDAWLDEEPTAATPSGRKVGKTSGKGKATAAKTPAPAAAAAPVSGGQQGAGAGTAPEMDKDALRRVLADALLGGLHCEHCAGVQGVVLTVPGDAPPTEPETTAGALLVDGGHAACLVCTTQVDWKSAAMSIERCRSQWQVCRDTVRFSPAGASAVALIEKFLQEADPEYAQYTTCGLLSAAVGAAESSSAAGTGAGQTAQAAAAERRRKQKCPVQLHGDHLLLSAAYALLLEHLSSLSSVATSAGQGATTPGSVQARTLYALRRVVRSKRALFQPHLHPEVATVQMQLVQQLTTAARQCAKGTHTQKELLRECADLLAEIVTSRSYAFGTDHALTLAARETQANMQK